MGATEEDIQAAIAGAKVDESEADQAFGVHPENWDTFLFFCSLQTRWRVVAMPSGTIRRIGLDWPSVESKVYRTTPRKNRTALLETLETLELEALKVFNEQN